MAGVTAESARETLTAIGQGHVFTWWDELDDAGRAGLLEEIGEVDWAEAARLVDTHVKAAPDFHMPENLEPAPYYPRVPDEKLKRKYSAARAHGESLIRQGRVAAFTVAGGQGTRLGWDAPKGTFPATPIRKLPLFAVFAEGIRKTQDKYESVVPWYVMTSPINDAPTRAYFAEHDHFGLDPAQIMIFPQGMMPAMDPATGRVLMADKGRLALSPNGHGGSLKALHSSGAAADMRSRGVEHISYFQVDNPTVLAVDPQFIGLHATDDCEMSSKMVPKAYAKERMGNFCTVDGRVTVIEYSDLPDKLAEATNDDGSLRFNAGSIAIHVIRVDFVERLAGQAGGFALPFHRAVKKVPYVDVETGQRVEPAEPNGVKLETFVFDALPLCQHSIVYETDRVEEFAPIKNAEGQDSPESARGLQVERAARWLQAAGVTVPRNAEGAVDAVIEIAGTTAVEAEDLRHIDLPKAIAPGGETLL